MYLADALYEKLGDGYKFIETIPMPDEFKKNGYPILERPYVHKAYVSAEALVMAESLANDADVVILGSAPESYIRDRLEKGKLTFHYNERWFKDGYKSFLNPKFWINLYRHHLKYRNVKSYMLCASSYTSTDVNLVGAYKNKCFRWGYFPQFHSIDIKALMSAKADRRPISIMWCSRFISWKHPELPIQLAQRLKTLGYSFIIDMFGAGDEYDKMVRLSQELNVQDVVRFCGCKSNDLILNEMRHHHIFLFTSDRNEGWGAVLNEAMSNGCVVVASEEIGSVPFLIEGGINGMVFKSQDLESLETKVRYLIDKPEILPIIAENAYYTIRDIWSPQIAANNLLQLISALSDNNDSLIPVMGPASKI